MIPIHMESMAGDTAKKVNNSIQSGKIDIAR